MFTEDVDRDVLEALLKDCPDLEELKLELAFKERTTSRRPPSTATKLKDHGSWTKLKRLTIAGKGCVSHKEIFEVTPNIEHLEFDPGDTFWRIQVKGIRVMSRIP